MAIAQEDEEVARARVSIIDPNRYQPEERISAREVREWLSVSPTTLWRWGKRGWLVPIPGEIPERRFLVADVLKLLGVAPA